MQLMGQLWPYESVVVGYFIYLIVTSLLVPDVPASRRGAVIAVSSLILGVIVTIATIDGDACKTLRLSLPLFYLPAAYWLPGHLVVRENRSLERILLAIDHRWFGVSGLARFRARTYAPIITALELSYLACYPLVPAGFITLVIAGYGPAELNRFWTAVLGAALLSYGPLPWLPSRPPREIETIDANSSRPIAAINKSVLARVSVGWNTFPSGHAAASVATALAVGTVMPIAGLIFGAIAAGICVSSVTGRYHYGLDAIAGVVVAAAAFAFSRAI